VDFENQQIHVSPKKETAQTIEWEPKDHEKRVVPMANETAQLLANLQAQAKQGFSYIFISPKRLEKIRERQTHLLQRRFVILCCCIRYEWAQRSWHYKFTCSQTTSAHHFVPCNGRITGPKATPAA
jgi:integrase